MAKANTTGANAPTPLTNPTPPLNPFIEINDAEVTLAHIEAAIALLHEYTQNHMGHEDEPRTDKHAWGVVYVLEGIQSAVTYLSHLEAVPVSTLKEVNNG